MRGGIFQSCAHSEDVGRAFEWPSKLAVPFVGCTYVPGLAKKGLKALNGELLFAVNIDDFFRSHSWLIAVTAHEKGHEEHLAIGLINCRERMLAPGLAFQLFICATAVMMPFRKAHLFSVSSTLH